MSLPYPFRTNFRTADRAFVALVDGAFQDAAARSGPHLLCRPGCSQCCVGVFAIGPADTLRLQQGLSALELTDRARARRIRARAAASWQQLQGDFPGDPATGHLDESREEDFEGLGNEEVCPVLDPEAGTCDLYSARPHTCRVFGPPVQTEEGFGVCELCFTQATAEEVAAAAMCPEPTGVAESLDDAAIADGAMLGQTIVAFALKPTSSCC